METLLKILFFPLTLFNYIRMKEKMLLFCTACSINKIEDPTVWDVDVLHKSLLEFIKMFQKQPLLHITCPAAFFGLFWHLVFSLFGKIDFPREDVKSCLEMYTTIKPFLEEIANMPDVPDGMDDADFKPIEVNPTIVYQVWRGIAARTVFSLN